MSNAAILKGLERIGYKGRKMRHGVRALAITTRNAKIGCWHEVMDRQFAHVSASKLSDRDVEKLFFNLEIMSFATRNEQEVAGYAKVMEIVFSAWIANPVTENYIKQFHKGLLVFRKATRGSVVRPTTVPFRRTKPPYNPQTPRRYLSKL